MRSIAAFALATAVLAACGTTPERTPTAQEAGDTVSAVAASVPATVGLGGLVVRFPVDQTGCEDPSDGGPAGRVSLGGTWTVAPQPSATEVRAVLDRALTLYPSQGWAVIGDRRGVSAPYVIVERLSDGIRVTFQGGVSDGMTISVGSACVWPNGVPPDS